MIKIESEDLCVDCDESPWRAYEFSTEGATLEECLENGWINEIDQDGSELGSYSLSDAANDVMRQAKNLIKCYQELEQK